MKKSIAMQGKLHVQRKLRELAAVEEQYKLQEQRLQGQLQCLHRDIEELSAQNQRLLCSNEFAMSEIDWLEAKLRESRRAAAEFRTEISRLQGEARLQQGRLRHYNLSLSKAEGRLVYTTVALCLAGITVLWQASYAFI